MFVESLPVGDYLAQIESSYLNRVGDRQTLSLWLTCKNRNRRCETIIDFVIHQPDQELQSRGRRRLQDIAEAVGVEQFEDSDQLHEKPFMLTVWNAKPMRWTCRPVAEPGKAVPPMESGSILRFRGHGPAPNGDAPGPHAA